MTQKQWDLQVMFMRWMLRAMLFMISQVTAKYYREPSPFEVRKLVNELGKDADALGKDLVRWVRPPIM